MAPVKKPQPSTRTKGRKPTGGSTSSKPASRKSAGAGVKRPPPKQVKTKPTTAIVKSQTKKTKSKPQYTDAQLNLPALNAIVPASATAAQRVGKGMGKKKNKVYVDDEEGMTTILAMVNAEKEGLIESKMIKERRLEEIREARRKEAEKRAGEKQGKLEEVKQSLKGGKNKKTSEKVEEKKVAGGEGVRKKRKSVSFV